MATRSNILLQDEYGTKLWYYRHWDGYPEGAMPTIAKFVELVNGHKIRGNAGQAGGWLIWLGMQEYDVKGPQDGDDLNMDGWKVGSIEPTDREHCDIEYRYTITLADGWGIDGLPRADVVCETVSHYEEDDSAKFGYRRREEPAYQVVDVSEFLPHRFKPLEAGEEVDS